MKALVSLTTMSYTKMENFRDKVVFGQRMLHFCNTMISSSNLKRTLIRIPLIFLYVYIHDVYAVISCLLLCFVNRLLKPQLRLLFFMIFIAIDVMYLTINPDKLSKILSSCHHFNDWLISHFLPSSHANYLLLYSSL